MARYFLISNLYPPEFIGGYEIGASWIADELQHRGHEVRVGFCHDFWVLGPEFRRVRRLFHARPPANSVDLGLGCVGKFNTEALEDRETISTIVQGLREIPAAVARLRRFLAEFHPDVILHFNPLGIAAPTLDETARHAVRTEAVSALYLGDDWVQRWPEPYALESLPRLGRLHLRGSFDVLRRRFALGLAALRLERGGLGASRVVAALPFDLALSCSEYIDRISRPRLHPRTGTAVVAWGLPKVSATTPVAAERFAAGRPLTLVFAGQTDPHKGLGTVIDALPLISPSVRLIVFGNERSPYAETCRRRATELSVADRIEFRGRFAAGEAVQQIGAAGEVLVFPSFFFPEAFGLSALEGFAAGMPVVAADIGAIPEVIQHGLNGLLFKSGVAQDLAAQVNALDRDRERCVAMGRAGRQAVETRYTIGRMVDRLEQEIATARSARSSRMAASIDAPK